MLLPSLPGKSDQWRQLVAESRESFARATQAARSQLLPLVQAACAAVHGAEASILIPDADKTQLRFLVSLNPLLDSQGVTFACDGTFSGFVFTTGQSVAKVNPEGGFGGISELTDVRPRHLLAVPITDSHSIQGVATFLNREKGWPDEPFSREEIALAQSFASLYAAGLKYYRRARVSCAMVIADLDDFLIQAGLPAGDNGGEFLEHAGGWESLASELIEAAEDLPAGDQDLLRRFVRLLMERRDAPAP